MTLRPAYFRQARKERGMKDLFILPANNRYKQGGNLSGFFLQIADEFFISFAFFN